MSSIAPTAGRLRLDLSLWSGGDISAFVWVGEDGPHPILRKCHSLLEKVLDAFCFPLVPYGTGYAADVSPYAVEGRL